MTSKFKKYADLVSVTLKDLQNSEHGVETAIEDFRSEMWDKWKTLYKNPGFIYNDKQKGGVFSVTSRSKYEIQTESGCIAAYSAGLEKEDKYFRDIFNRKKFPLCSAEGDRPHDDLVLFAYEAPLLRVVTERDGQYRISADLVALDGDNIVIIEAKLPDGDPLDKAILQAYGYAFFLACHLTKEPEAIVEHIKTSVEKFHKNSVSISQQIPQEVRYMIVAPNQYFYENFKVEERVNTILDALKAPMTSRCVDGSEFSAPCNPVFGGFAVVEDQHLCFNNYNSLMRCQVDMAPWRDFARHLEFSESERLAQIRFKQTVWFSDEAKALGELQRSNKIYKVAYCLPQTQKEENLFVRIRADAYKFFDKHSIKWHETGENHLLSSQAYCVNFLFPFSDKPEALKVLLLPMYPDIEKMLPIEDDRYVTFEWNGGNNYLQEHNSTNTRGEYATYPDAAVRFERKDGKKQIVLIEWKYTEQYTGQYGTQNKAGGSRAITRLNTYKKFIEDPDCPLKLTLLGQNADEQMKALFYEPFYQLAREQLLAHEMEKDDNTVVVSVLHVCPDKNKEFHTNITSPKIKEVFNGKEVIEIWKELVKNPNRFLSTGPEQLFWGFPFEQFPDLKEWARYMSERYRCDKQ